MKYNVLVGCENDKTGKRFEPGDTCKDGDFPKRVIKDFIQIGVLEPIEDKENGKGQTAAVDAGL